MRSDSNSNGSGGAGAGGAQIPPSSEKVVQDLKEVVNNNCTDSEIYAVLRDCNMDPNEAVQRLLSQDTFHEVKSRRERRKEMKETQEPKTRSNYGTSNHGLRGGNEHSFGWSRSVQMSSSELGKAAYSIGDGSVASIPYSASSTLPANAQNTWNEQPSHQSNSFNADNRRQSLGTGDKIDASLQLSHGSQSAWLEGTTGHVTMADIVRMGRPQSKGSQMPCETSYTPQDAIPPNTAIYWVKTSHASSPSQLRSHHDFHYSDLDMPRESAKKSSLHDFGNEWPIIEPTESSDIGVTMYSDQSYLHSNRPNLSGNCLSDNILVSESKSTEENPSSDCVSSVQASGKQIFINGFGGKNDDDMSKNTSSPDSYRQIYEHQEGMDRGSSISFQNSTTSLSDDVMKAVSSATANLQLSLGKEAPAVTKREEIHGVVLPDYLQGFSIDCSHLSFGTYKSGKSIASSQPQASSALTNDLGDTFTASDGPSSMHTNSRNSFYNDRQHIEFDFDADRATVDPRNYSSRKSSMAELSKLDIPDAAANGNDHISHSSLTSSSFKNIQQLSSKLPFVVKPNARNLPPFPIEVQSYSNSSTSDLGAETFQSLNVRDSAAFLASQSISSRPYVKNSTTSMSEALNSGTFSVSRPPSQALHVANLATGPVLKEHLPVHSCSQTGYSAIPQAHTYIPSALQQTYPDGNLFHESLSGMKHNFPQHRSANMTNLPLSGSYTSGYECLGAPTDIPGNFLRNPIAGTAGSKVGYDDLLPSQYRDGRANFNLLRQNDGSAIWDYGHGSRTVSTLQNGANYGLQGQNHHLARYQTLQNGANYGLQGQNHHLARYQQSQPHSQLHEFFQYPDVYNSQQGITREQQLQQLQRQHQRQNLRNMILNGSQGPSSRQLPQIWEQSY